MSLGGRMLWMPWWLHEEQMLYLKLTGTWPSTVCNCRKWNWHLRHDFKLFYDSDMLKLYSIFQLHQWVKFSVVFSTLLKCANLCPGMKDQYFLAQFFITINVLSWNGVFFPEYIYWGHLCFWNDVSNPLVNLMWFKCNSFGN